VQCFPTFLGLWHHTAEKYNLRNPVDTPQQFALSFDDNLQIIFLMIYCKLY